MDFVSHLEFNLLMVSNRSWFLCCGDCVVFFLVCPALWQGLQREVIQLSVCGWYRCSVGRWLQGPAALRDGYLNSWKWIKWQNNKNDPHRYYFSFISLTLGYTQKPQLFRVFTSWYIVIGNAFHVLKQIYLEQTRSNAPFLYSSQSHNNNLVEFIGSLLRVRQSFQCSSRINSFIPQNIPVIIPMLLQMRHKRLIDLHNVTHPGTTALELKPSFLK